MVFDACCLLMGLAFTIGGVARGGITNVLNINGRVSRSIRTLGDSNEYQPTISAVVCD
jgi:hypothetical protein